MNMSRKARRKGGIAPLTCVLLVLILGTVAFAVDISYIALTQSELQNAADSAALAGANKLADNYVLYTLPSQSSSNKPTLRSAAVTAAKTAAQTYAGYCNAGAVNLTLLSSDIEVGYTSANGTYTAYSSTSTNYPNTVKVTMRRDSSANTSLGLFFAPVLGVSKMDLTATATATLYTGTANSLGYGTLPVTYDYNDWGTFVSSGKDKNGTANTDSSGNPLLQVWASIKDTGNFGLLSLNDSDGSASTISGWIENGLSDADIKALKDNSLIPLSSHNATKWDWKGSTGFKASNAMDLNAHIGETFLLPLYKPYKTAPTYEAGTGNGTNYDYNIVQFVGVKIMPTNSTNKEVLVQPAAIGVPPSALTNVTPADGSTFSTVFTVKLVN